ncbi:hypothetical protein N9D08_01825 [bacterium]|nr:hypothetical protein [bacterium]
MARLNERMARLCEGIHERHYDKLIRELEHVSSDVRDTLKSFVQELRDHGVRWHSVGGVWALPTCAERFRDRAGPCVWATRMHGSACLKYAHENGSPWHE